jgi:hypothetical protein
MSYLIIFSSSVLQNLPQSTEFWAGVIGAIVGATISAMVSFALQQQVISEARANRQQDNLEKRRALATALMFKVMRIHSDFATLHRHIEDCFRKGSDIGPDAQPWQFFTPLATFHEPVHFTNDETVVLFGLKNNDVFAQVVDLDARHNSLMDVVKVASLMRRELTQRLTPERVDGYALSGTLSREKLMPLMPQILEVHSIIEYARPKAASETQASWRALEQLSSLLRDKLDLTIRVEPLPEASAAAAASAI